MSKELDIVAINIQELDLSTVKEKLKIRKGWWWNLTHDVDKTEKEYKKFLYLIAKNPNTIIVPWSDDLDDLWHEHILDTRKYEDDCNRIFGKYIHHNPHLAVGSPNQVVAFKETQKLYQSNFGGSKEKSSSSSSDCGYIAAISCAIDSGGGSDGGSSCGSSCGSGCGGGCGT